MPELYISHPDYGYDRDFKGYGEKGLDPKWPNNSKIAVSFVINYEEVCTLAQWKAKVMFAPEPEELTSYRAANAACWQVMASPKRT